MSRPPVFLLSDFGGRDAYVGVMKARIASLAPGAPLVDLVHELPPQDLTAGQLQVEAALPYLPAGAVLLAVVDPGVGGERRGVALDLRLPGEPPRPLWAVAPDNGLLTPLLSSGRVRAAVGLRRGAVVPPGPGSTFDGRDLFAPAAGALAAGAELGALGAELAASSLRRRPLPEPTGGAGGWRGEVLYVDRFGNLITNVRAELLPAAADTLVRVGAVELRGLRRAFADVEVGAPLAYVGSLGRLELALRDGDAASAWGAAAGTPLTVASAEASAEPPSNATSA